MYKVNVHCCEFCRIMEKARVTHITIIITHSR